MDTFLLVLVKDVQEQVLVAELSQFNGLLDKAFDPFVFCDDSIFLVGYLVDRVVFALTH
jgi:hypothetical protein